MITRPADLPHEPPAVTDFQRARVIAAEEAAWSKLPRVAVAAAEANTIVARVCDAYRVQSLLVEEFPGDSGRLAYMRDKCVIRQSGEVRMEILLHEVTHHVVSSVFPAHGIEFVTTFIGMLERFHSAKAASVHATEFSKAGVHMTTADRVRRVRRVARFATGRETGVLAQVVLDGPPTSLLGQLLSLSKDGLLLLDQNGEHHCNNERLRYIAYRFSE